MLRVLLIAPKSPACPGWRKRQNDRIGDVPGVGYDQSLARWSHALRIQSQLRRGTFDVLLWSGHGTDGHLLP